MSLFLYPKFQAPTLDGVNLSGGRVYFYEVGTSTPKDTYTDESFGTPNSSPVILNARGEADIFMNGAYKVVLHDADDVEIWTELDQNPISATEFARTLLDDEDAEEARTTLQLVSVLNRNFLSGLTLSNAADAAHDITIAIGSCADSSNSYSLELTSPLTKRIDASYATGNNAGGLSSSLTVANNTSYHYFLVKIAGSIDVLIDTSPVCANGITDHSVTKYRRLGAEKTDGSANIIPTLRRGINVMFDVPIVEHNGALSTTGASLTISTPSGIRTEAIIYHWQSSQSGANVYARLSSVESTNLTVAFGNATNVSGDSGSFSNGNFVRVTTDLGSNIRERASTTNAGVITLHGYNDISILEGL